MNASTEKGRELLLQILDDIGRQAHEIHSDKLLTGFIGRKGACAADHVEMVVVGRAGNGGWLGEWSPGDLADHYNRTDISDRIMKDAFPAGGCPMSWVSEQWRINNGDYNTNRSAFWRVIHNIIKELGIADAANWSSYIAWTNLYKIAPASGGNPSEKLCKIQEDGCIKLLENELGGWEAKRVLFLTGIGWARPFLNKMNISFKEPKNKKSYIEAVADFPCPIIIAKHPQGKNERKWCTDVIQALKDLS